MSQYFENDKNIKSEVKLIRTNFNDVYFEFYSDNGVFSKSEVDYGSKLLIKAFVQSGNRGKILDVGGGIGIISIILSRLLNCESTMVEINDRAIDLSRKNINVNHVENSVNVIKSDVYENVKDKYDFVITNPPIRAGKIVIYKILFGAFDYLNENGELWFVMRKNHGALTAIKDLESRNLKCEIIDKDKGFFIIKVKK